MNIFLTLAGWIYKQVKGTCVMHAMANALEKLFRGDPSFVPWTEDEVWAHFRAAGGSEDTTARDGAINFEEACRYVKEELKLISDYKILELSVNPNLLVNAQKRMKIQANANEIGDALQKPNCAVVGGFFIVDDGDEQSITLDKDFVMKPSDAKVRGAHAMHILARVPGIMGGVIMWIVENSWGKKFGLNGLCFMKRSDVPKLMSSAVILYK